MAKIAFDLSAVSPAAKAQLDKAEWWEQRRARSAADRQARREKLEAAEQAVNRACAAYDTELRPASTETETPSFPPLQLRYGFVALRNRRDLPPELGGPSLDGMSRDERRQRDRQTRPPMTRMTIDRSKALPTFLGMVYAHQADPKRRRGRRRVTNNRANAVAVDSRASWATICGRWHPSLAARRARLVRDLDDLERARLLELTNDQRARYEGFKLLSDDGSEAHYRIPNHHDDYLELPSEFIRQGWHLVLTPAEIATLMVIHHMLAITVVPAGVAGVGIPRTTRAAVYGLSPEAYESVHELEEFGLITVHDPMPHRRQGFLRARSAAQRTEDEAAEVDLRPETYQLAVVDPNPFARPALRTVHAALDASPAAPRFY